MSEFNCYETSKPSYILVKKIDDNWNIIKNKETGYILWHCSRCCKKGLHCGCNCKSKSLDEAIKQKKFFTRLLSLERE